MSKAWAPHTNTHTTTHAQWSVKETVLKIHYNGGQFRETAFKESTLSLSSSPSLFSFVLLSSQTEPVQPTIYLCDCVCMCMCVRVCPVFFILQSGPLLLGNLARKKNSDKDIPLSLLLSPFTSLYPSNSLFTFWTLFLISGSRMRDYVLKFVLKTVICEEVLTCAQGLIRWAKTTKVRE